MTGDFNFRDIHWDNWVLQGNATRISTDNRFLASLRDNLLLQHVNFPTRAGDQQTPHLLDLVITNDDCVYDLTNWCPLGKSDHSVLSFKCSLILQKIQNETKFIYSKGNYDNMRLSVATELAAASKSTNVDVNSEWKFFKNIALHSIMQHIPQVEGNI